MNLNLFGKKDSKEINKVLLLPVDQIVPNPHQPRKYFGLDDLQELSRSIIANGLLQPITVRRLSENRFELIAGERRLLAFRAIGRDSIPAIVEEFTCEQSATLALIENLQRKNLNYFEEAAGIERLMRELGLTQQQVSQKLGKAQSTVANKLRLLRFSPQLQDKMISGGLTERHARTILKLEDQSLAALAVEHIVKNELNVEQSERYVDKLLREKDSPKNTRVVLIRDMRLFMNSINKAVDLMNSAGIKVETSKNESDTYLEYTLKVKKSEVLVSPAVNSRRQTRPSAVNV